MAQDDDTRRAQGTTYVFDDSSFFLYVSTHFLFFVQCLLCIPTAMYIMYVYQYDIYKKRDTDFVTGFITYSHSTVYPCDI